ncbi:MAG: VWA domain-containing protein [Chloroflexota bacterium]
MSVSGVVPTTTSNQAKQSQGRRGLQVNTGKGGVIIRAIKPVGDIRDVALMASLRSAIVTRAGQTILPLQREDLRVHLRKAKTANLILFVVDASGSMGARKRMVAVKGAILSLLLDAYQKRDQVGLITFRGDRAQLLVRPTNSVELAERQLRQLPTGGRTPFYAGLQKAATTLHHYTQRNNNLQPLLICLTDGRANVGPSPNQIALQLAQAAIRSVVIDSEQGFVRMGQARQLAQLLKADYIQLDDLGAQNLVRQVKKQLVK